MNSSFTRQWLLAATLLMAGASAVAEDIDIYQANNTSATSNLLVVLDNSGAWNGSANTAQCPTPQFAGSTVLGKGAGVQACGMWKAVDAIGTTPALLGKLNMGVMLLGAASTNGGIFKFPAIAAPNALVNMNDAGIAAMKTVLQGLNTSSGPGFSSNTSNGRDVGGSTWEAWAFYAGKTGASGTTYPGINADTCGKNFVIRVGIADNNAQPGDYNAGEVNTALANAGASAEQLTYIKWTTDNKFSSSSNYWADEWARFSKQNNEITTYTITLVDTSATDTLNVGAYKRFMKSMADNSGGKAFVVDINDMDAFVQALLQIFNEIQAVNSVFAAASLPISTNATGSFLNQIYFGMFRPDAAGLPRWAGNLKQYRFALDRTDPVNPILYLADARADDPATGLPYRAINSAGTGFFSPNAVSYWTSKNTATLPDSIDPTGALAVNGGVAGGFFIYNPQSAGEGFDLPDGEIVEKGGVAQRIRLENLSNVYTDAPGSATNPRRLYTCTSGTTSCVAASSLSATPFATTNDGITDAALGAGVVGTPISTLTRNDTTASVTLSSSMSPVLANGQLVTITGATAHPRYVGTFVSGGPPTATTLTYSITVLPPASATGSGYTATVPGTPIGITSIARSGATATVTTAAAHGFGLQTVSIAGAGTGYDNGAALVLSTPTPDTFTYAITVGPANAGAAGAAAVGATSRGINSITLGTPSAGAPYTATANVELTASHSFTAGQTLVITGVTPIAWNGSWTITSAGTGNSGACPGNPSNKRVCFSINTTPGAATISGSTTVSVPAANIGISGITRPTSCTGGTPSPVVAATATTSVAHPFVATQTVTISGGDANSERYTGVITVLAAPAPTATTFSYNITTSPDCSDVSAGKTASAGGADKTTLIRWVRGSDNRGDEASPGSTINVRPSVHGDVLHSRPAVINYGGSIGVVLFYGANNGVFHAVNGNQTGNIGSVPAGGVPPGGELWGFVASEFFPKFMRQYLNSPVVKLEATAVSILPAPQPKDYFFDGSIGVYKNDATGKVYLYLTARRGERVIYALDVSDPTDPKFMWKKSNADFPELGQTWSTPSVVTIKGYNDGATPPVAKPVLIFGAGYDPAEDAEPPAARTMGRGIFILDAVTGALVWQATGGGGTNRCTGTPCQLLDMTYPIPSDVMVMDRDTSDLGGYIDRAYVGDLGGNIWRVDFQPTAGDAPANWQVSKFASIGGSGTTKRKIFFPPDVVSGRTFDRVMFSTGDREHPTRTQQAVNILNRFYMLKDTVVTNDNCPGGVCTATITDSTSSTACVGALPKTVASCTEAVPAGLFNGSSVLPTSASTIPARVGATYDNSGNGFYMNLLNAVAHRQSDNSYLYGPEIEAGEKAVNAPTTIAGNTFFGTNTPIAPEPGVCQPNLGTARGYAVNFVTGQFNFAVFDGGGLPPTPVSGLVDVGGIIVPFVIGGVPPLASGQTDIGTKKQDSSLSGTRQDINVSALRTRTYWYRDIGNR